jgi:hypothetical protein
MDISIFVDKKMIPTNENLKESLNGTYDLWKDLTGYVHLKYPSAVDEWKYSGDKYGWSFRIKDTKRVIVYLLPRDKFFKTAFVFGQKATDAVMNSRISENIKSELESAKVYAEGRGIRIDVENEKIINNIKKLIDIKIEH